MTTAELPNAKKMKFHPRILGSPAPVFPGFEMDISDHVHDEDKPDAVWHRTRAKEMIRAHPEIKGLFGNNPWTAFWCVSLAVSQVMLAVFVSGYPWWVGLMVAYVIGSLININLFQLAHECNHNLVFKKTSWNRWLFTLTSLPMFMSAHHSWWIEHHVHHNDLGAKKDFVKRRRTVFLLTRQNEYFWATRGILYRFGAALFSPLCTPYALFMLVMQPLRSAVGLLVYFFTSLIRGRLKPEPLALSILADEHLVSGYEKYRTTGWAVVYPLVSLTMTVTLFVFCGWKSVCYLLSAQLFMTGFLHPFMFGLILSNSHFHGHKNYQPSSSYYGWLNWITFNFGLHTEHHDISGIPWNRLPKLRAIAPEFYDTLQITKSYAALAMIFTFGRREDLTAQFDNEDHRNEAMLTFDEGSQAKPDSGQSPSESDAA